MASFGKPSSRYSSYDTRSSTSSHLSDPSSSAELRPKSSSRALVKPKPVDLSKPKAKPSEPIFTAMVKKFMEKPQPKPKMATKTVNRTALVIPSDLIAEDLKKTARKGSNNLATLHKKLFGKGTVKEKRNKEVKALTEVKGNTRTLAMVLRSERELLTLTKDQEIEISELKTLIEDKNTEVEKLKDLCLKQREEIKALKNAILFPDVLNSQFQNVLEKQGSELKQAKQLIPTLQRQVTSLTGQLQCLAEDLAEVKANNYSAKKDFQHQSSSPFSAKTDFQRHSGSPISPRYSLNNASNSSDFSLDDPTSPASPDDMLLKDMNPCLTPYYANSRSKEFEGMGYDSPRGEILSEDKTEFGFNSFNRKLSKSSDCCENSKLGITISRTTRRSDETKSIYGRPTNHKLF